jgi:hypothetical protein
MQNIRVLKHEKHQENDRKSVLKKLARRGGMMISQAAKLASD